MRQIATKKLLTLSLLILSMVLFMPNQAVSALPVNVGDVAPDIVLPNANGANQSLYALRGNIVLVHFWVSWDPNSRINNPNLAIIHDKYQKARFNTAKGFQVYTVSLDSEKTEWTKAITKDKLPGIYHVNDFYSKYAATYKLDKLPASFLVDENGKVIGKNLSMAELDKVLGNSASGFNTTITPTVTTTVPVTGAPTVTTTRPATTTTTTTTVITSVDPQKSRGNASQKPTVVTNVPATVITTAPVITTTTAATNKGSDNPIEAKLISRPKAMNHPTPTTSAVTPTSAVVSHKGLTYKIQLGAYQSLQLNDFYGVSKYGVVSSEAAANGINRVMLGEFGAANLAVSALQQAQLAGYNDAFVVVYDNDQRKRVLTHKEVMAILQSGSTNTATTEMQQYNTVTSTTAYVEPLVIVQQPAAVVQQPGETTTTTTTVVETTQKDPNMPNYGISEETYTTFETMNFSNTTTTVDPQKSRGNAKYTPNNNSNMSYHSTTTTAPSQIPVFTQNGQSGTYYDDFKWYPSGQGQTQTQTINRNVDAQKPYATNPANVNQGRGNAATTTAKPKDEKVDCSKCPCDNALLKEKQAAAEKAAVEEAKVKEEVAEKENLDNAINKYLKSYNYDALDSSNDRKLKRKKRQLERKIRRAQMRIERQKGGL